MTEKAENTYLENKMTNKEITNGYEIGPKARLACADLRKANLDGMDLSMADMRWADLRGASMLETKLTGAKLEGATIDDGGDKEYVLFRTDKEIDQERKEYQKEIQQYLSTGDPRELDDITITERLHAYTEARRRMGS